jgi:hypothetical protein
MSGISGYPSQEKLVTPLSAYGDPQETKTSSQYVTVSENHSKQVLVDTKPHGYFRTTPAAQTIQAPDPDYPLRVMTAVNHGAIKGDFVRFELGSANEYFEAMIISVPDTNNFVIGSTLPNAPIANDPFYILRSVVSRYDESGSPIVSATNPSVGLNGVVAPLSSTEIGGIDPSGNLQSAKVNAAGELMTGDDLMLVNGQPVDIGLGVAGLGTQRVSVSSDSIIRPDLVITPTTFDALTGAANITILCLGRSTLTIQIDNSSYQGLLEFYGSVDGINGKRVFYQQLDSNNLGATNYFIDYRAASPTITPIVELIQFNCAGLYSISIRASQYTFGSLLASPRLSDNAGVAKTPVIPRQQVIRNFDAIFAYGQSNTLNTEGFTTAKIAFTSVSFNGTFNFEGDSGGGNWTVIPFTVYSGFAPYDVFGSMQTSFTNAGAGGTRSYTVQLNLSGFVSFRMFCTNYVANSVQNIRSYFSDGPGIQQTTIINALPTGSNLIGYVKSYGLSKSNAPVYNAYATTNVTTAAYVQLIASTTAECDHISIFDSSGEGMIIAVGAAAAEVDQLFVGPGGGEYDLLIPAGSRVSIKAKTATANSGYLMMNLLG